MDIQIFPRPGCNSRLDMMWKGLHTVGCTTRLGTRCWLNPESGLIFDSDTSIDIYVLKIKPQLSITKLKKQFKKGTIDSVLYMYGDSLYVQYSSLTEVINALLGTGALTEPLKKQTYFNDCPFIDYIDFQDKDTFYVQEFGNNIKRLRFFILYKLKEIIAELQYVNEKARQNKVTFQYS